MRRALRFALVGASGTVLNLAIMAVTLAGGLPYLLASLVATQVTILTNFALQERFVFADRIGPGSRLRVRLAHTLALNNGEWLLRAPVLALLVELAGVPALAAQALALAAAFVVRITYLMTVVYRRPKPEVASTAPSIELEPDHVAVVPG